ncbi:hypothetical protein GCM10007147_41530 [Nocardiopsis kunsanensis]|uniref:Uncharacterized protein n=1 Tax=Nocardiopsis kunsanensis TaxID=141693 RepID=A0A919CL69_9ACTN|nr:hypothetical protein GCM10007147_41530 [Nocardiopsis kunsanensis]
MHAVRSSWIGPSVGVPGPVRALPEECHGAAPVGPRDSVVRMLTNVGAQRVRFGFRGRVGERAARERVR